MKKKNFNFHFWKSIPLVQNERRFDDVKKKKIHVHSSTQSAGKDQSFFRETAIKKKKNSHPPVSFFFLQWNMSNSRTRRRRRRRLVKRPSRELNEGCVYIRIRIYTPTGGSTRVCAVLASTSKQMVLWYFLLFSFCRESGFNGFIFVFFSLVRD